MHTWKTHLIAALHRLRDDHAGTSVSEAQHWLCGILEAQSVTLLGPDDTPPPPHTTLTELLTRPFSADLRVNCATGLADNTAPPGAALSCADTGESRFTAGDAPRTAEEDSPGTRFAQFVRDFDRLERKRGFMWAGYIVRELLPRLGFPPTEAKVVLDRLRSDGILTVSKVENPRNPDFPATAVHLNREHPQVQEALASSAFCLPTTPVPLAMASSTRQETTD